MTLTPETIVVASRDQLSSTVGGETVILGIKSGRYYGVDAVSARVWQLIQTPTRLEDVVATLVAEYAVERSRCESDVLRLAADMEKAGIIEVSPAQTP